MSRECEICMHRSIIYNVCRIGGSWVDLPPEGKCDDWKPHKNVEIGMEIERARCLEIVKQVCSAAVGSESTRAGVYLPEILAEEITKQIRGEK